MMIKNPSIDAAFGSPDLHQSGISGPTLLPSEPTSLASDLEQLGTNSRKRTLLALIDELAQLRDEEQEKEQGVNYAPTTDERLLSDSEGVERFKVFDERIRSLNLKLQAFVNAVRRVRSGVGLLNAASRLSARLTQIQYFFRENAANLFEVVSHGPNLGTKPFGMHKRGKVRRHAGLSPSSSSSKPRLSDIELLPQELEHMAKDLHTFLDCLNDVPEFTDETINASIQEFEGDLKYRASCLRDFEGQLQFVAVAQYINYLTEDLGVHLDSLKDSLDIFIETGVPTIRLSQKDTATGLQNLSVVIVGKFSHEAHGSTLSDLVNAFWISSLVFSIASAINSQLAYHWRAAMYRSPRSHLPWWVAIWIIRTPLLFLVGSVIAFSAGLCVYTYSSNQSVAVCVVVTTFIGITFSALLCVGIWFASERWVFARTQGKKGLLDVLEGRTDKAAKVTGIAAAKRTAWRAAKIGARRTWTSFNNILRSFSGTSQYVTVATAHPTEAPASAGNVRTVFTRTVSPVVDVANGLSTSNQENTTPQNNNLQTNSPTPRSSMSSGRESLGTHGSVEEIKLSYLDSADNGDPEKRNPLGPGPSTEHTIPEDEPPHFDTLAPLPTTSSQSAGDNSKAAKSGAAISGNASTSANPVARLIADNRGGDPEAVGSTEGKKLLDSGKRVELAIPEDTPLQANTKTPVLNASPPSAGDKSETSGSNSVPGHHSAAAPGRNTRFRAVARRVLDASHTWQPVPQVHLPEPIRSMSTTSFTPEGCHRGDSSERQLNPARMQSLVPMLRTLRSSQTLGEHVALVKHLQFSPDGQFLATCSWDKTTLIWRVGSGPLDEFSVMHKLVHTSRIGGFVGQVAWSPSGDQLLTKQLKAVQVWDTKTGVCKKTIDRKRNVQSIAWMPKGSGFVFVEWRLDVNSAEAKKRVHHTENIQGSDLVIMSADGSVTNDHYLPRLHVWDAAVTPDEERIVAVASLLRSKDELKPMKSRNEKRILIYNLHTKEIENQVPLLQEVRNVTLTEQGNYALVSYESQAPPQAWRIDMITREQKCRLVLAHTYFTKHPVDFAGPSYFGGVNDSFVLCASKGMMRPYEKEVGLLTASLGGEIYIWERASGILLHSLKAPDQDLTNIACNYKSPSGFMFASGAHDGIVRIWTTARPTLPHPSRSLAPSPEPAEVQNLAYSRTESLQPFSPSIASPASTSSLGFS
ncbi:WD40 repeat-like protein [Ceratobasidium sp. AG-I]|nr:WD40 repeat-like protein [Ceratobasidium sp. AG-I]